MFGEMLVKQLVKCYQLLQKNLKNNKYYFLRMVGKFKLPHYF